MKKLFILLSAALLVPGSAALAQETVASNAKKLQQLYVSVGTGPALTTNKDSRTNGGQFQGSITAGFGCGYLVRTGVQKATFTAAQRPAPGAFAYLNQFAYNSKFYSYNEASTLSLTIGKPQNYNNLIRFQVLGGFSLNYIETRDYISPEKAEFIFCGTPYINNYLKPGLIFQAEAMFLPSKFAGLTTGAYLNLTPKMPNAGLSLSMNLGKLK